MINSISTSNENLTYFCQSFKTASLPYRLMVGMYTSFFLIVSILGLANADVVRG